jgi:hypothetical protein
MKSNKLIIILFIIVILVLAGVAYLYFFWPEKGTPPEVNDLPYDYPLVTVSQIKESPQTYDGKNICLFGYYTSDWEWSDISSSPKSKDRGVWPTFADLSKAIKTKEKCQNSEGIERCHGWLTVCGKLTYSLAKLGHLGGWDYEIVETNAKSWSL